MSYVVYRQSYHDSQKQFQRQLRRQIIKAVTRYVAINVVVVAPLVIFFGFTIPIWSLATTTIGFGISVLVISKCEKISKWKSTLYSFIIFILINTIGILLFGSGSLLAVGLSIVGSAIFITIFIILRNTRRILLFFVRNVYGKWVGYTVSLAAFTSIITTIIGLQFPFSPKIEHSLQQNINQLSITLSANALMSNCMVIYPKVEKGQAFMYISSKGNGQIVKIPTKEYTSYYERIVALLTRTSIDADGLIANKVGTIRKTLLSQKFLQSINIPIIIIDGNMNSVNFNAEFPLRIVFRSVSTDIAQIEKNIINIFKMPAISPNNTRIVNGIPTDEQGLKNLEIEGNWSDWSSIPALWQDIITKHGYSENMGKTSKDVLAAIKSAYNILIIVAHGDGNQIYFPDGSQLKVEDFSKMQEEIHKTNPLIILFSCETAKIDGVNSYAKSLIELGAQAVIAPTTEIGAKSSNILLDKFFEKSASGLNIIDALQKSAEETNIFDLENWISEVIQIKSHINT